jgi:hypothetical protein
MSRRHSKCLITSAVQVGHYGGLAEEVESLKRDKNVLMMELVQMRQRQQVRRAKWRHCVTAEGHLPQLLIQCASACGCALVEAAAARPRSWSLQKKGAHVCEPRPKRNDPKDTEQRAACSCMQDSDKGTSSMQQKHMQWCKLCAQDEHLVPCR